MYDHIIAESIRRKIYCIRGKNVILDSDLALLYGIEKEQLHKAVQYGILRFPGSFMFRLSEKEYSSLLPQSAVAETQNTGGIPSAITEQGVAMLSVTLALRESTRRYRLDDISKTLAVISDLMRGKW